MPIRIVLIVLALLSTLLAACSKSDMQGSDVIEDQQRGIAAERAGKTEEARTEVVDMAAETGNRPPMFTVAKLVSELEQDRSILRAEVEAVDDDGDEVSYEYEWKKNGVVDEEAGSVLREFKRGDQIILTIRAYDGKEYGRSIDIRTEIANTAPTIIRDDDFTFDGKTFSKQIRAEDADGDQPVFTLVKGPEGMKIDPSSGMLSWTVPPDLTGSVSASVEVGDGHGGKVSYNIEIPISFEEEKKQQ